MTITISPQNELLPAELAKICAQAAESKKASDIIILDVGKIVDIAQYFVICSANNDRLVRAIATAIQGNAIKFTIKPTSVEGQSEAQWILVDYGSVVVHVFLEKAREFYRIERLFKDADELSWKSLEKDVG